VIADGSFYGMQTFDQGLVGLVKLGLVTEDDARRTYVEFTLEPAGAGTRLTVVETGFAQLPEDAHRKAYDGHTEGWSRELGELAGYLDAS